MLLFNDRIGKKKVLQGYLWPEFASLDFLLVLLSSPGPFESGAVCTAAAHSSSSCVPWIPCRVMLDASNSLQSESPTSICCVLSQSQTNFHRSQN